MRRLLLFLLAATAVGCAAGPDAPSVGSTEVACAANFCVEYPEGWVVELGADYVAFSHPAAPETAKASVGQVNMEGIVAAAGGTWPVNTQTVVRDLWSLLDEGSSAEVATVELERDGSVRSFGTFGSGRMWHRLVPTTGAAAVGVEVRGPNSTWEEHAVVFLDGLTVTP